MELYAIKKALLFFWPLNGQQSIEVFSDHKPLEKVIEHNVSNRYIDLIETIESFSIKIKYINGKSNVLADMLSRVFNYENMEVNEI